MRARLVEFPRGLEQLKELDNNPMFILIGNHTNHFRVKSHNRTRTVDNPKALSDLFTLALFLW